ncbi:hypothetical protein F511_38593 [Dorcoceras hygrometricum]|uniref:Secreted protein n=1 Tax=Dorcoceras hygrometricum TaxID=472368 RepID=A0A2Z7D263_9LAMI|nr:hypothetical protein F511_38593 [Dorcoceras hygrometricum]
MLTWISVVGVLARIQLLRETNCCERPTVVSDQLLVTDLCCSDFVVAAACGNCSSGAGEPCLFVALFSYQILRASGNTALLYPCWYLLATMRRVVNYHSSWFWQQHVELFDASGIPGFTVGRGFNPAGGSRGGS